MREKIFQDMIDAMKSKSKKELSVLRAIKGSIQLKELELKKELNDDEVISIVSREIKMREESIMQFEKGNRDDLIAETSKEVEILNKYLPTQLTEEELLEIIEEVFNKVTPTATKDLGRIMGTIMPLIKGKADMNFVNKSIKEKLENL